MRSQSNSPHCQAIYWIWNFSNRRQSHHPPGHTSLVKKITPARSAPAHHHVLCTPCIIDQPAGSPLFFNASAIRDHDSQKKLHRCFINSFFLWHPSHSIEIALWLMTIINFRLSAISSSPHGRCCPSSNIYSQGRHPVARLISMSAVTIDSHYWFILSIKGYL